MGDFLYICFMERNDVILYLHLRKDNGKIFYVGIGVNNRPYLKGKNMRSYKWHEVVKDSCGFNVKILMSGLTWKRACELEVIMIKFYGREDTVGGPLVNLTDGGDGVLGRVVPERTRKSIKEKQKKTYDEYIAQVEEKWGFNLAINRELFEKEYENNRSKITCECVKHGIFVRKSYDIIAKHPRGCYDCMKIKHRKAMSEYERTPEYRNWMSKSRKGIDKQTKEYKEKLSKEMTGSGNRSAKLTEKEVIEIRKKYIPRVYTVQVLAKEYKVSKSTISGIVNNMTWSHI